jgi:DNA-binding SARP family transcriptional activator
LNARWKRRADADRETAAPYATILSELRAREHASVRNLFTGLPGAAGPECDPIVTQLVEAARRVAAAWSELCDKTSPPPVGARTLRVLPGRLELPAANQTSRTSGAAPILAVCVLGPFRVLLNDQPIEDWPNCKAKAIFKYLLLNRKHPVSRKALMECFWPEAEPEAARNSLNVAMHRLRRALGRDGFPFVLFADGHYRLNPKLMVSTDADAFLAHATRASELERAQEVDGAVSEYAACVALYQGDLLAEDRHGHDEWALPQRQQLRDRYLHILDRLGQIHLDRKDAPSCTTMCAKILAVDPCNEGAHRMLMRCYARLGQPQLAQQQYQACIQALNRELGIPPSAETTGLYRQIVRRDTV